MSMSRSLSVSGKEGHHTLPIKDEDPNFDRDHGGLNEIMQASLPGDLNTPSRNMVKNHSDSIDSGSPKQPKLYKESTAKLYA